METLRLSLGTTMAKSKGLSVTLPVGTLLFPYGIAHRRFYGFSGGFQKALAGHRELQEAGTRLRGGGESATSSEGSRLVKRVGLVRSESQLGEHFRC